MLPLPDDFIALRYRRLPAALLNPSIIAAAAIMAYSEAVRKRAFMKTLCPAARGAMLFTMPARIDAFTRASARNGI
jgi:hypothetical protein